MCLWGSANCGLYHYNRLKIYKVVFKSGQLYTQYIERDVPAANQVVLLTAWGAYFCARKLGHLYFRTAVSQGCSLATRYYKVNFDLHTSFR